MSTENHTKSVVVHVRMTPDEQARFQHHANGNLSSWMRRAALDAAITDGPHLHADLLDLRSLLTDTNRELVAHGRNLNQIAKHVNSGGQAACIHSALKDIQDARIRVLDIAVQVSKAMKRVR
ncbi:plasmid mobilization relaxosome protein MobC [Komagataeibacter melomenusus]|uniref:plasmid mobilization protein n=1 Tax=Komagataeibacter melomenusus TaxID=2766578 RepID=UPI001C2D3C40|nr:plasmid mobilization relaxosome protein MobC [Komagataeibacter melomenusus]MBV1829565.1 plasmid mobilization relaxosome protein MobC [Komagataeibacter melomenusus]